MSLLDKIFGRKNAQLSIVHTSGKYRKGRITIIKGEGTGSSITVDALNPVRIGRSLQKSELVIPVKCISRIHCLIEFDSRDGTFIVTDLSVNGTYVKGQKLPKNIGVVFRSGTILNIANEDHAVKLI